MSNPLLATKLNIPPPRPNLVPRPRLIERLDEGLCPGHRLTLISAPAGFGKTTLVTDWLHGVDWPSAWVSLDEADNDPVRFWTYVIAALQTMQADVGDTALAMLQSPQPPPIKAVLTTLINEISEELAASVLVLDDYHVIETQPIHNALAFLVEHMPRNVHLVIATRADPPLPLARLRACGQMIELRAADLRFTSDEAAAFLNDVMNADLAAEDVAAIESRTEGWAAGLQLAALSLRQQKDQFVSAFTGDDRHVADYLVEQVLSRQPEEIQNFLLQSAILERFCGPLCDAVVYGSDQGNGQEVIEQLERTNLFVVPLDNRREWYRFHQLFADLLRYRLRCEHPQRIPELHRRASAWFEEDGDTAEAVSHALAAEDFEQAARLIKASAPAMLDGGELATLIGWLDALPAGVIRSRPWLCISHAWALVHVGQVDAIEPRLQDAERAVDGFDFDTDRHADAEAIAGHIAALRANVAFLQGDIAHAIEYARHALQQLPETSHRARALTALTLFSSHRMSGDLAAAGQVAAEVIATAQLTGSGHTAVLALCGLADAQIAQGQLRQAYKTYQDALQLGEQQDGQRRRRLALAGYPLMGLSEVLREWNDLEAATHQNRSWRPKLSRRKQS